MSRSITRKEAIRKLSGLALLPVLPPFVSSPAHEKGTRAETPAAFPAGGRVKLQPFEGSEVKLGDGPLNRQVAGIKNYYLEIPNDDLLKGFRERKGLPVYGARDLGGWYTADVFHIFGQILSGLARLYAATGDEGCREKCDALIEGWAACLEPDGYFYYSRHPNARHYVYDKMVGGLVDALVYTGNRKAAGYLSVITDWAVRNLDRRRPYAKTSKVSNEWYTLSENLYRACQATGDPKFRDFGAYWEYPAYWNQLAAGENIFTRVPSYHAYSHLNTLSGAAMAYMLKGEARYLEILKNGYAFFQDEQCFVNGGFGPNEKLLPKDQIIEALKDTHRTFETQCGSWAAFKLCRYLMMFTGNADYGDWIEKLIYNGAGADIPLSPDGKVLYYSDYNPREGAKHNYSKGWTCCNGTRPQDVAAYAHLVYLKSPVGLCVNLYTPSTVTWNGIRLTQQTRFPQSDQVTFTLALESGRNTRFTLRFRRPGWLAAPARFTVNGEPAEASSGQGWLSLGRTWKDGDEIRLILPAKLAVSRLDPRKKYPAAITWGPVTLAMRMPEQYPSGLLEPSDPFAAFTPVEGAPLNWHVQGFPGVLMRPYYAFKEGEPYILYLDPSVARRLTADAITAKGSWQRWRGSGYYYSREKGAALTASFTGTGIRLYFRGFPNSGKCRVLLDGKPAGTVDFYRPRSGTAFQKEYLGLAAGKHRVTVEVLGEKSSASTSTFINVSWFEALE